MISTCPLQKLTRKKVVWQGTKQQQKAFDACKNGLIEHLQFCTPTRGHPFELEVIIPDDIVSRGLRQMTGLKNHEKPVGFWSKVLQGSTTHYIPNSLILHPLLISDSQVLVFQVSSRNTCALSRGDSIGMVLLLS